MQRAKSKLAKKLNVGPLKIDAPEAPIKPLKPDDIARLSSQAGGTPLPVGEESATSFSGRASFEKANADEKSFFEGSLAGAAAPATAFMDMLLEGWGATAR